jgi:hypothetical protein
MASMRMGWASLTMAASCCLAACAPWSGSGVDNIQNGNSQSRHVWRASGEHVDVPFEWDDGHLIIPVRVNGSVPVRLAFDTGAAATVLFETSRTRSLALQPEGEIRVGAADGRPGTPVSIVADVSIDVGAIGIERLSILHVPLATSPIFGSGDEAYFDGAIGYDLLHRYVTEIDYVRQVIRFSRKRGPQSAAPWQTLPIDVSARVPYVAVRLRDDDSTAEGVKLLVDTGAPSYTYVNPELIDGLDVPSRSYVTRGNGFNGPFERTSGRLRRFDIGGHGFDDLLVHFDRTDFKDLGRGVGLIGNGVLANFDLLLDYSASTLSIRPNARFEVASAADRSGIDLEPHTLGGIVQSIADGSGASEIGMKRGDIVTHLDGRQIEPAGFDQAKALLSSARTDVEICWRSGIQERCTRLPLEDRL